MDCVYISPISEYMLFEQARDYIFTKLEQDLPANLSYHNIHHVHDVYACTKRIARAENIADSDLRLLLTAAAYHDAGFIKMRTGHEEESCRIARDVLPVFDYTDTDINKICGMIMATQLPQSPKNHLEEILADADLDYLGRDDFFSIGDKLFEELDKASLVKNHSEWNRLQADFMEKHSYFTATSIAQRKQKEADNLKQVKAKLKT